MSLLQTEFPIQSQTSDNDKLALLQCRELIALKGTYRYLEIGSFLGGSLTPFLRDARCVDILSVDARERVQPDERGSKFDYRGITHQTMIDNLHSAGLTTAKVRTFDGSIDQVSLADHEKFDLVFIDGEHTDWACFRDFIHSEKFLDRNAIVAFHDSTLVYKSLSIIIELLKSRGTRFQFCKVQHSEMSFILFDDFATPDAVALFNVEQDLEAFYRAAERKVLTEIVKNRVSLTIQDVPTRSVGFRP